MIDLSVRYLGLPLSSPLVASSSPLTGRLDEVRRMEDAGAAAVVLPSLFEEQIELESHHLDHHLSHGAESYSEAISYFPDLGRYSLGPEAYMEHLRRAKAAVGIPVLASLNGISPGGWTRYARLMEEAGADALELNVYYMATDLDRTSAEIELMYLELARAVKASVRIPVAIKIGHAHAAGLRAGGNRGC